MRALFAWTSGQHWLPGYILCRKPWIVAAYDQDFLRNAAAFAAALPKEKPIFLLLQLGWQHETAPMIARFQSALQEAMRLMPNLRVLVLTNTPKERELFLAAGIFAEFCHQNAFLDPARYPLCKRPEKRYDAIYIARITPFKRHELAQDIDSLLLIGDHFESERSYYDEIRAKLAQASWKKRVYSFRVAREIATARCGLCLSKVEGAMFVSAEYLLSGVPIVNTPSIGGREELFPDFAVRTVGESAAEVAAAVAWWREHPLEPLRIREAFLELAAPHRQKLSTVLAEWAGARKVNLPHKLGLRCSLWPWQRLQHGILRSS